MIDLNGFPVLEPPVYRLKANSELDKLQCAKVDTLRKFLKLVMNPAVNVLQSHGINSDALGGLLVFENGIGFVDGGNFPTNLLDVLLPDSENGICRIDPNSELGREIKRVTPHTAELFDNTQLVQWELDQIYAKIFPSLVEKLELGFANRYHLPQVLPGAFFIGGDKIATDVSEFTNNFETYDYNSYLLMVALFVRSQNTKQNKKE